MVLTEKPTYRMGDCGKSVSSDDNDVLHSKSSKLVNEKNKLRPRSSSCQPPTSNTLNGKGISVHLSSARSIDSKDVLDEREVLMQHHHDLSNLCRDLEQHKLDMQRQHMQLAEALRNIGTSGIETERREPFEGTGASTDAYRHHRTERLGDKQRVRKEGRDEHGMNGASSFSVASPSSTIGNIGSAGGGSVVKRDIWSEELASESLEEGYVTEIPELNSKSIVYSSELPPRTIPFRSASFSQVDITSEGKYVRNPRSPITLKPTAFCLMNNSYASGSSTLPRAHAKQQHRKQQLISSSLDEDQPPHSADGPMSSPMLSRQKSCDSDCGSNYGGTMTNFPQHFTLPETISEQSLVDSCNSMEGNRDSNIMTNVLLRLDSINSEMSSTGIDCEKRGIGGGDQCPSDLSVVTRETEVVTALPTKGVMVNESDAVVVSDTAGGSERGENEFSATLASTSVTSSNRSGVDSRDNLQCSHSLESEASLETTSEEAQTASRNSVDLKQSESSLSGTPEGKESTKGTISMNSATASASSLNEICKVTLEAAGKAQNSLEIPEVAQKERSSMGNRCCGDVASETILANVQSRESVSSESGCFANERSKNHKELSLCINRSNKPQLIRSPPLIREESIMARSSSEEGPKSDQDEEPHTTDRCILVSNASTEESSSTNSNEKSLPRVRKGNKKHVLLELDVGGNSSISGSGGEDDPDKDKHGLYRQSSGQSDESAEGDRQSDGCTSPPIANHPNTALPLHHRSQLSAGNSPLTEALALDSPVRRGSTSTPSTAPIAAHSASNLHSTSLPQTSSVVNQTYFKGPTNENCLGTQRESDRLNSLSSPNVNRQMPPRRYNKRPLRGPYGEMLEAEMKKLVPRREFDNLEFWRESKSSSPSRTLQTDPDSSANRNPQQQPIKLANSYLMSSMDDLNLTNKPKHSSTRSRKISANLPVTHYHTKGQ